MTLAGKEFDGFCSNEIDETDGRLPEFSKGQGDREVTEALSDPGCQEPWELSRAFSASGIGGWLGAGPSRCKPEVERLGDGWVHLRARKVPEGCYGTKQM